MKERKIEKNATEIQHTDQVTALNFTFPCHFLIQLDILFAENRMNVRARQRSECDMLFQFNRARAQRKR